jgi:hypothetical protein
MSLSHLHQVFTNWFSPPPLLLFSMARRSPRKKAISPETIVQSQSDDEDFLAVASDDQYAASCPLFVITCKIFSFYFL